MKVLFICRHNRFRSKVAESYLKRICDKNVKVTSSGIIQGTYPLGEIEVKAAKTLGVEISGKPKGTTIKLLRKQDFVVIVADDIPIRLFDYEFLKGKVMQWKITDDYGDEFERAVDIVRQIKIKVEEFNDKIVKALA